MRVLALAPDLPYPADSGGRIRTLGLLRHAAREVALELWCVARPGLAPGTVRRAERELGISVRLFPRSALTFPRRLTRGRPEGWFESEPLRRALRVALDGDGVDERASDGTGPSGAEVGRAAPRFDLVHVDEPCLIRSLSRTALPVVVHHHKLDLELHAALSRRGGGRPGDRVELARLRRLERLAARRHRVHVVCCAEDALRLRARHPRLECGVVPSGVEPGRFAPAAATDRSGGPLLFLGTLSYGPNVDGLERFLGRTWPALRRARPGLELEVVGRNPCARVRAATRLAGVRLVGPVDDVRPWLARAAALVAPLAIGGGTRVKLVEALAAGTPVIATPTAAEGLPLRDGAHCDLAPLAGGAAPGSFGARVLAVLADPTAAAARADRGRALVEAELTWPVLARRLVKCWREALERPRSARAPGAAPATFPPEPAAAPGRCATRRE